MLSIRWPSSFVCLLTGGAALSACTAHASDAAQQSAADTAATCTPGQLDVAGTVSGDQTWTACNVTLTDTVTVTAGSALRIRPGVTVRARSTPEDGVFGHIALLVDGAIDARGAPGAPITFSSEHPTTGWAGITVRSTARNVVSTTRVENAKTAIDVVGAVDIADSVLSSGASFRFDPRGGPFAYAGLHLSRGASARVSRSAITGFNGGIVSQQAAALTVTDTIVRHNYDGIVLYGSPTADDGLSCQPPPVAPTRPDGCNPLRTWDCSTPDRSAYDDGNIVEDPMITHDDIIDNFDEGIQVGGHMVLQLSNDNFANGLDLSLMTDTLDPASFVRSNNFSTREPLPAGYTPRTLQNPIGYVSIITSHHGGTLDATGNYWGTSHEGDAAGCILAWCNGQVSQGTVVAARLDGAGARAALLSDLVTAAGAAP
jgi:hypothetical protein